MLIQSRQQFEAVRTALIAAPTIVVDTETTGLFPHRGDRLCGIATLCPLVGSELTTGTSYHLSAYFPFRHKPGDNLFEVSENLPEAWLSELLRVINRPEAHLIFHNRKFDEAVLHYEGCDLVNERIDCTLIMSWLNNENESHELEDLCVAHELDTLATGYKAEMKQWARKQGGYDKVTPAKMEPYACKDVELTWLLYQWLCRQLDEQGLTQLLADKYKFARKLLAMELLGIGVDLELAKKLSAEAARRMRQLEDELGFDPLKLEPLARRLFLGPPEGLGLPIGETTKTTSSAFPQGVPAMREEYLSRFLHEPLVASVLEYRGLVKANSTWFEGFQKLANADGRLRTTFNSLSSGGAKKGKAGTKTGRLNSSKPNVQQIPRVDEVEGITKNVKQLFTTGRERWHLYEFDYAQIEFRIGAVYADAELILDAFRNGEDAHRVTAENIGCSRQAAKHATYCTLYGGGPETLAKTIERLQFQTTGKVISYAVADAAELLNAFFGLYPGFKEIGERTAALMRKRGYVYIWDGRKRHYEWWYKDGRRRDNAHAAFNSICQGGAAAIIERSMLDMPEKPFAYCMVSQVHDSLWVEIVDDFRDDYIREIKYIMEWPSRDSRFKIPFDVDVKILR